MAARRQTARDLVEEGKKRVVLLLVCVFGLSYLMSLTSSSVWINLPAAASLIIFLRYISLDLDVRRRTLPTKRPESLNKSSRGRSIELPVIPNDKLSWRRKVNSPIVEAAINQFTRHLVSEWVTDLWYSRITPDKDGPEELVQIMNDVFGEVSSRARDINLIDMLTRDIIDLFCSHLELYRSSQAKIGKEELSKLSIDDRDAKLKVAMAEEKRLHPALVSLEAEHKVMQDLVSGLISLTFKPEDLQCSYFRITVREILACAVLRPVLNLCNPRFINEKVESLVISLNKKNEDFASSERLPLIRPSVLSKASVDQLPGSMDHSNAGVELVQFKHNGLISSGEKLKKSSTKLKNHRTDFPIDEAHNISRGDWAHMLDVFSTRKTQALAPEHFDNMWTKGRNYKKKEDTNCTTGQVREGVTLKADDSLDHSKMTSIFHAKVNISKTNHTPSQYKDQVVEDPPNASLIHIPRNHTTDVSLFQEKVPYNFDKGDSGVESEGSYGTDDDDGSTVTGLDSPGTRVWESKNRRNSAVSHIRHPLESFEINSTRRTNKNRSQHTRIMRPHSIRKKSRSNNQKVPVWQEVERTSFLLSDNSDILNVSKVNREEIPESDESETETWGRIQSGSNASSSLSNVSPSEDYRSLLKPSEHLVMEESFLKLRCEVLGANIVKCGLGTFAVYSISVSDATNHIWSIKRRFRHFEELHRRLKEFSEYNLSLPPKHFLSSGLDEPVVKERCTLLDKYLKMLIQLPSVSKTIEVWDFLSVDSQTYIFSDSFSIIQTISADWDDKSSESGGKLSRYRTDENINEHLHRMKGHLSSINEGSALPSSDDVESDESLLEKTKAGKHSLHGSRIDENQLQGSLGGESGVRPLENTSVNSELPIKVTLQGDEGQEGQALSHLEVVTDPTIPIEWAPPNLSMPILDLVDVVFQLQDGDWMRRQVFWIAKQVLQLGMGDAFDDWLIEKIQLLRQGSVVAYGIKRLEQILWPDGIFITKHPSRRRPTPVPSPKDGCNQKDNISSNLLTKEELIEASRRAKFVHELIIEKAPAALVGLIGRKDYERCAEDIYFFLQSSLCLRQLAIELLELLLLAAFPELDSVVRKFHRDLKRTKVLKEK